MGKAKEEERGEGSGPFGRGDWFFLLLVSYWDQHQLIASRSGGGQTFALPYGVDTEGDSSTSPCVQGASDLIR